MKMLNSMLNMRQISTRELLHDSKRIQAALARGESFEWTSRGKVIGIIQPVPGRDHVHAQHGWLDRARLAGAVIESGARISDVLYADRE